MRLLRVLVQFRRLVLKVFRPGVFWMKHLSVSLFRLLRAAVREQARVTVQVPQRAKASQLLLRRLLRSLSL